MAMLKSIQRNTKYISYYQGQIQITFKMEKIYASKKEVQDFEWLQQRVHGKTQRNWLLAQRHKHLCLEHSSFIRSPLTQPVSL